MKNYKLVDWVNQNKNKKILHAFLVPKTPTNVRDELSVKKFNLKPYLKRNLLKCLNPESYKGRLYILTNKARKLLNLTLRKNKNGFDYTLFGWIISSPKQRAVILETLSKNLQKYTSEEIRTKASKLNPCLSRISTKNILNELIAKNLVDTKIGEDRRRYYWINEKGKLFASNLD